MVVLLSADGEAAPSATVFNVALAGSPIFNEFFMLARQTIGGVAIDPTNVLGWSYSANQQYEVVWGEGPYPEEVVLTTMRPTVEIETDDTSLLAAGKIPEGGLVCTHANTSMFLRKFDAEYSAPVWPGGDRAHRVHRRGLGRADHAQGRLGQRQGDRHDPPHLRGGQRRRRCK